MKKLKEVIEEKMSKIARHEIEKWLVIFEGFALNVLVPMIEDWINEHYTQKKAKDKESLSDYLKKNVLVPIIEDRINKPSNTKES